MDVGSYTWTSATPTTGQIQIGAVSGSTRPVTITADSTRYAKMKASLKAGMHVRIDSWFAIVNGAPSFTDSSRTVRFSASTFGGSPPVTGVSIEVSLETDPDWGAWTTITPTTGDTYKYTTTGLDSGATYFFQVRAVNETASGQHSAMDSYKTRGISVSQQPPFALNVGDTGTYHIVLAVKPSSAVTVSVASSSEYVTASPASLTFTTANWDTPQTVTVTSLEGSHAGAIITHAAGSTDSAYNGMRVRDVRVYSRPIANAGPDKSAVENTEVTLSDDSVATFDPWAVCATRTPHDCSDAELGKPFKYEWSGPYQSTDADLTFTAPEVEDATTLSFTLKVTDSRGAAPLRHGLGHGDQLRAARHQDAGRRLRRVLAVHRAHVRGGHAGSVPHA